MEFGIETVLLTERRDVDETKGKVINEGFASLLGD